MNYSLIVPYFKTPEITRLCLYSIFKFSRGEPEVIVVDNAPGSAESAMLREFSRIKLINNSTALRGSAANFEALDLGLAQASHDLVALIHSDTIFLGDGWDLECFGRLRQADLAALGTCEREANPFRSLSVAVRDWTSHLFHSRRASSHERGKLQMHFLLTRKSLLEQIGFVFRLGDQITPAHYAPTGRPVEVLSRIEMSRLLWHTSNITSLLTGQMDDPKQMARYRKKRRELMADADFREAFGPVLPRD